MWRVEIETRNRITSILHSIHQKEIDDYVNSIELLHWKCVLRVYNPQQVMVRFVDLRRAKMSVLSDGRIRRFVDQYGLFDNFAEGTRGGGIISYGLSSAGYDVRLGNTIKTYRPDCNLVIDPKKFGDPEYQEKIFNVSVFPDHYRHIIPPHGYLLAHTVEYIRVPRFLDSWCVGKSTYARCGLIVNTTPLEPEWEGQLTLELSNPTELPIAIYIAEGIAQIKFVYLSEPPEQSYKDKGGKYDKQTGVTPPRN